MKMRVESHLPVELEDLVRQIIGAAIEVHKLLGPGFIESIYEQALCHELELQGIVFERQKEIAINYKGRKLLGQRLDLFVGGRVLVELKTVEDLAPIHEAQLLSYMRSTKTPVGLLINFNVRLLKTGIKRIVL